MKYQYMDGTGIPIQRDIISDMHVFFDALATIIPLAQEIESIDNEIKTEYASVDNDIQKLKQFREELESVVDEVAAKYDSRLVGNYIDRLHDVSSICFTRQSHQAHSAFHSSKHKERRNLGALRERISKTIAPVSKSCMPDAKKRYMASMEKGRIRGRAITTLDNVSCAFAMKIRDEILTIRHLINSDVYIPVLEKNNSKLARIISESGKYINIADYLITSFDCHNTISMTLANKKSWLNIHINPQNYTYSITYNSENDVLFINESSELPPEIKKEMLNELLFLTGASLTTYLDGIDISKYLSSCTYNNEDAIETNHILDVMRTIAAHYAPLASECLNRGRISTEISIRIEDGQNSQVKTISLNQIVEILQNAGPVGAEFAAIFNIDTSAVELKKARIGDIIGRIETLKGSKGTDGLNRFYEKHGETPAISDVFGNADAIELKNSRVDEIIGRIETVKGSKGTDGLNRFYEEHKGISFISDIPETEEKSRIKREVRVNEILDIYDKIRPVDKDK
ncbi:MAG: hypothetical protein KAH86_02125 [Methanosarcinales archaeon]|nr:hypothetical protein [Methanosarcinales archaeon]